MTPEAPLGVLVARVLVVEDDAALCALLVRGLEEEGYRAAGLATGAELLGRIADGERADALVIDIGLPDTDGRDVCHALRAQGIRAPVMFLTARDALPDRLAGFSAGGDDYLTKPFAFAELLARLEALLRRGSPAGDLDVAGIRLDPSVHGVVCGDAVARLTPIEFRLLAALAARAGDVVRRQRLLQAAWPHGAIVHDNTLDVYMSRLRRKLRELPGAPDIVTVHGVGYSVR